MGKGLACPGTGSVGGSFCVNPAAGAPPLRTIRKQLTPSASSVAPSPSSHLLALSCTEWVAEIQRNKKEHRKWKGFYSSTFPGFGKDKAALRLSGCTTAETPHSLPLLSLWCTWTFGLPQPQEQASWCYCLSSRVRRGGPLGGQLKAESSARFLPSLGSALCLHQSLSMLFHHLCAPWSIRICSAFYATED